MKMTVDEVAAHMGCSTDFVREAIKQGKIRGAFYIKHKSRHAFYIDREEFLGGKQNEEVND